MKELEPSPGTREERRPVGDAAGARYESGDEDIVIGIVDGQDDVSQAI